MGLFPITVLNDLEKKILNITNGEMFALLFNNKILNVHLALLNKTLNDVHVAKKPVVQGSLSMMMAKIFPYVNRISAKIITIADTGLLSRWISDAETKCIKSQQIYRDDPMEHIRRSLFILLVGNATSLIVFSVELLSLRIKNLVKRGSHRGKR